MVYSRYKKVLLFFVILPIAQVLAQPGLQMPKNSSFTSKSDSLNINFPTPVLPLPDLQRIDYRTFELEQDDSQINVYQYISHDIFPTNPFEVDLRYTSNYVPRWVRDDLNQIMDRPRDSAFLPILPVAFIALQMASQYLLIRHKTEITAENILNSEEAIPVLQMLWITSPQTLTELYAKQPIRDKHTMRDLERLVNILIDNNLVRTRLIENAETKYFAAIQEPVYQELKKKGELLSGEMDSDTPDSTHNSGLRAN